MKFIKKYLKIIIGVAVLIGVIVVFTRTQHSTDLESGNMKNWRSAANERRIAAVKILIASEENVELIVACVDKIADIPDSGDMNVRDAVALCHTGIQLREHI
ncbi:MAG: hypothetical protein IJ560_00220 [Alphaproteobacteria bacterium]|nr:hypothetical protein [Alphaproteobacteria bacterium]